MTAETHAPTIAEQSRRAQITNIIASACLTAKADHVLLSRRYRVADTAHDELTRAGLLVTDTTTAIVDAVLARYHHRANYPLAADFLSIDAYETATERWRIDDHNLDRAITRAAETHLNTTEVHR